MAPAALLAIVGLGLVLAYVIPQRIKERSDYALVRTEDRYSAQMRVVKATASRVASGHDIVKRRATSTLWRRSASDMTFHSTHSGSVSDEAAQCSSVASGGFRDSDVANRLAR